MEKKEYYLIPDSLYETDKLTFDEKAMLSFLFHIEDLFDKIGDWFELTDDDFIKVGYGKDKVIIRRTRNSLIEKGFISFKCGRGGKKSQYKIHLEKFEDRE